MTKVVVPVRTDEEENEVDDERDMWLRNPVTLAMKESFRKMRAAQQAHLFAACGESTDPNVRGHFARYLELGAMVGMLEKGPKT